MRLSHFFFSILFIAGCAGEADLGGAKAVDSKDADISSDAGLSDAPTKDASTGADGGCDAITNVQVQPGGQIYVVKNGNALRLGFSSRGSEIAIRTVDIATVTLPPSDVPHSATSGFVGYWAEIRDVNDAVLWTRVLVDFTHMEGAGGSSNGWLPYCQIKLFDLEAKLTANSQQLVIFGPPYGTSGPSVELVHFRIVLPV